MSDNNDNEIKEAIKALTHEMLDAVRRRDEPTLDRILSDDFVIAGWQPEGRLADKKFYIADAMTPVEIESGSYRYDAWKFRIHGNVIIVNCTLDIHAIVNGHPWGGEVLITHVWINEQDQWRLLSAHTSPIVKIVLSAEC